MSDQVQGPEIDSMTPEQAQGEIQRLSNDKEFTNTLLNSAPFTPAHREASARWRSLQEKAHGSGQQAAGSDESAQGKPNHDPRYSSAVAAALEPPETPDGYKTTRDGSAPEWDAELETEAKQLAHSIGLSGGALEGFALAWNDAAAKVNASGPITQEQSDAAGKEMMGRLRQKHGAGADDVIAKARWVINGLPHAQRERAVELLEVSGLGNSIYVAEQLAMLAERKLAKR